MAEHFPQIPSERYADDVVIHCKSKAQARFMRGKIEERLPPLQAGSASGEDTNCSTARMTDRPGSYPERNFDFLGFTFSPHDRRKNRWGKFFVNFSPGASQKALKRISAEIRSWATTPQERPKALRTLRVCLTWSFGAGLAYYGNYYKVRPISRPPAA